LLVEPSQPLERAIALTVRIENTGTSDASFINPYDGLTYKLNNAEGWPIGTRAPPSRAKIRGRTADRSEYLRITDIEIGGTSAVDIAAQVALEGLLLPAGMTYEYHLRIENVVPPQGKDGPTTIVPGSYTVRCLLSLRSTLDEDPRGAVLETEKLDVRVQ
jgi:hypothetical protein